MKRLLLRLTITLVSLSAIAGIFAYMLLANSLPHLDGEIFTAGVQEKATIERDSRGIPTIIASSRIDLAFATGYAHAQDRFFQMDLTRRQAAGELAELFGEIAVGLDKRNRFHRFRDRSRAVLKLMTGGERAVLQAYVDGVNEGLNGLKAKPFEYFILSATPRAWNIEDSLLTIYSMYMELNDERASRDVKRGYAHDVLPADVFAWMYPDGSQWDSPLEGLPREPMPVPGPTSIDLRDVVAGTVNAMLNEDGEAPVFGSNNWAVSGRLTTDGRAIVANDMHLNITTPNVFYRARLVVSGADARDVNGVTLPGTPVVVSGSNGKIAWGFTNSYGDWTDAVLIRRGSEPNSYMTPDGPKEFVEYSERIDVKDGAPVELVIRETIWGPVLDDARYPDHEIAVSWIGHHSRGLNVKQLLLETAESVPEALSIANQMGIPPQNFVSGDSSGNIGWTIAGQIPNRGGAHERVPADWSDGSGWSGWLAADEYPRLLNPDSGRIWTANSRVVDGDALRKIGDGGYDFGARARQIRDGLFEKETFEPIDMLAIQLDDRALFLDRWRDLVLTVLDDDAIRDNGDRAEYRALVRAWTPRASIDSVGYRLVRAFRLETRELVFDMLTGTVRDVYGEDVELHISKQFESALWQLVSEKPPHMLSSDYASWRELMLGAVDRNLTYFSENWTDGLENRTWGERNTAAIRHPLSRALPVLSKWLDMPSEPLNGDSNLPRAQGPAFGASERYAVSPGDEINGYLHMPAGQSGHPLSDYYRIGHDDWVHGRPTAFLPGEATHVLVISPQS